jgi:hypothetical protein
MTRTENLMKRLLNDIGGLPAEPVQRVKHELEPWEKRCHAVIAQNFVWLGNWEADDCATQCGPISIS